MTRESVWQRGRRKVRRNTRRAAKVAVQGGRRYLMGVRPELHGFVVGAQRSGTNMVMKLLDRSYDATVYHERDPRAFNGYLMRDPEVIQGLIDRAGARAFMIKALCEMDRLPGLMSRFAPARVIWVYRHYDDVINASLRSFSKAPGQVSDLVEDPEAHGWMGRGMSAETHAKLQALHRPDLNDASKVALFWYIRNRLLFDTGLDRDPRVLRVHYEQLVGEPDRALHRLFAFLGLRHDPTIGCLVSSRSGRKAPAPSIDPDVRAACDETLEALAHRAAPHVVNSAAEPLDARSVAS